MLVPFGLACRSRGLDPNALFGDAGIRGGAFLDLEAQTTHAAFTELFALAEQRSNDPAFALLATELVEFGIFLSLDQETPWLAAQAFASSATVGEGLARFARCMPVVHAAVRYDVDPASFTVRYSLNDEAPPPRGMVESAFGILAGMLRTFPDAPVDPVAVRFAHRRGGSLDAYRRVLRVTPDFEQPHDEMTLSEGDWRRPLRTSRPRIAERIDERIASIGAAQLTSTKLRDRAVHFLAAELARGTPTAERLAERLGVSVRTLHRRLREEGTTHRQLLEDLRKERAWRLLVDEGLTVREATMQLGFSEPAAFKRAVKRWFGRPPAALRANSE